MERKDTVNQSRISGYSVQDYIYTRFPLDQMRR